MTSPSGEWHLPEVTVSLDIHGFSQSPGEIGAILELQPTDTWIKGELVPGSAIRHKENHWIIKSAPDESLQRATESVLDVVWPVAARFAALPDNASVQFYCAVHDLDRRVMLSFPLPTLEKLAALRADLNLVYYGFMSDDT